MTPDREFLHPRFLADADEYLAAERFWADLFGRIADADGWRTPWFDNPQFRDGNPIFTAISPVLKRGIRVTQGAPEEAQPAIPGDPDSGWDDPADCFVSYRDTFAKGDPEAIDELVISCVLTRENADKARELMRPWIAGLPILGGD